MTPILPTQKAPAMGAHRYGQRGPPETVIKCFVHQWLQQNAQQIDYLCIIFTSFRRLLGALPPDPTGVPPLTPLPDFRIQTF